ncbi:unnamed protein product [Urochloa humidicola]
MWDLLSGQGAVEDAPEIIPKLETPSKIDNLARKGIAKVFPIQMAMATRAQEKSHIWTVGHEPITISLQTGQGLFSLPFPFQMEILALDFF